SDFAVAEIPMPEEQPLKKALAARDPRVIARMISLAENRPEAYSSLAGELPQTLNPVPVLGITGTGGAGKSSLVDELVRGFLSEFPERTVGIS
ncbi:hypothetical protein, partial [Flagellimonas beolgyonensis]|uniref:hypothetical protein n=1 Tax=Flagellimonas beolgyonensis TaxID=864064 RepID=UPI003D6479C0